MLLEKTGRIVVTANTAGWSPARTPDRWSPPRPGRAAAASRSAALVLHEEMRPSGCGGLGSFLATQRTTACRKVGLLLFVEEDLPGCIDEDGPEDGE